ncbi:hypothetical protein E2C01_050704 [Portunus trituberculatus]|uniref:Uncharacterized protein n=1 Tax=Portunus trituberculatus TaxID=210409 RepID=A0A5B7GI87_PORTR|nr:hypothetical protein [Portunus trituberculatus]
MTACISQHQLASVWRVLELDPQRLLPVTCALNAGARITSLGIVWLAIEEQCVAAGATLGDVGYASSVEAPVMSPLLAQENEHRGRESVPPSSPGGL